MRKSLRTGGVIALGTVSALMVAGTVVEANKKKRGYARRGQIVKQNAFGYKTTKRRPPRLTTAQRQIATRKRRRVQGRFA